ncbi:hypothetical protein ACGFQG_27265 [Nocardia fluminea]|uniref:hypothetical protein n=1 Tax=Nocardia fluminea TaxID=134984 RepID=UPI003720DB7E
MNKFLSAGAAAAIASGIVLGGSAAASHVDAASIAGSGSGSAGQLVDLASLVSSGSAGAGSSFGITVGDGEDEPDAVADTLSRPLAAGPA